MPQMIALALLGGLGWYAWRAFRREMDRIGAQVADEERKRTAKEVTVLEEGPDGVYRPRKR